MFNIGDEVKNIENRRGFVLESNEKTSKVSFGMKVEEWHNEGLDLIESVMKFKEGDEVYIKGIIKGVRTLENVDNGYRAYDYRVRTPHYENYYDEEDLTLDTGLRK